jgi:hypothetical protein
MQFLEELKTVQCVEWSCLPFRLLMCHLRNTVFAEFILLFCKIFQEINIDKNLQFKAYRHVNFHVLCVSKETGDVHCGRNVWEQGAGDGT